MSRSYTRMNYITSFGFSLRWRKQFIRSINPSKSSLKVIDLMTGMGESWGPLRHHFPNADLYALDFSEGMMKYAAIKKNKSKYQDVKLLHEDILQNKLKDNYFDVVVCSFGLKTFNKAQLMTLAKEVNRILKPNGKIAFIEVSAPSNNLLIFFYKLHLKYIVPFCGRVMLGNPDEYRMLWKYTSEFGNSEEALKLFQETGLLIKFESYFGGCASGFSGSKEA